jgi:hypothetical protein
VPSVPNYLVDLAQRARAAADAVEAARLDTREELAVRVVRARTDAERVAEELHSGALENEPEAAGRWKKVHTDWNDHVLSTRVRIRERRTAGPVENLAEHADDAERYARFSAALAAAAVQEAEFAALDAALARADAQRATA